MKWQDLGYVLSAKNHGESSKVVSIFTQEHGRHMGLWRGSSKALGTVQVGNFVACNWSARLPEHLGMWQLEVVASPVGRLFNDMTKLLAVTALTTLVDQLLAERHYYPKLYQLYSDFIVHDIWTDRWLESYVAYEINLLEELGFGLDLQRCAVTGQTTNLKYVSPKSGRAVSAEAGEPYKDKLLGLPGYLLTSTPPSLDDLKVALRLSGYFLQQHLANKGLPQQRQQLLSQLLSV